MLIFFNTSDNFVRKVEEGNSIPISQMWATLVKKEIKLLLMKKVVCAIYNSQDREAT